MSNIKTFSFDKNQFNIIKKYRFGSDWPVVYIIENGKEAYVGETTDAYARSNQHWENPERHKLNKLHIISDEEYNKSAALDIESSLIEYMSGDGTLVLQNSNGGLSDHSYYDREKYTAKFEVIWDNLKKKALVKKELIQIRNSDIFKYSPYKALTEEQFNIVESIRAMIGLKDTRVNLVSGNPGTGKTIVATYLVKRLLELEETKNMKIGLVVPMTSLRSTLKKVFRKVKGLNANMVIGPSDVAKDKYDLLIVDEAHRLKRRVNITNYKSFDKITKMLGFEVDGNELDWIIKQSTYQVLFYDKNQSVKPSDIRPDVFLKLNTVNYELTSQLRVKAGEEYIEYVENILECNNPPKKVFKDYEFYIYDDINKMVKDIKEKDKDYGLARMVAGYAWPWNTKGKSDNESFDIEIDGLKLKWNSTNIDFINSPNAINEVGCIHTVQGYDLNYTGLIIGPEVYYDKDSNQIMIDPKKYFDMNGKRSINAPEELKRYIINIYKTLMTRGIRGTYLYVCDEPLREYMKKYVSDN
ncbi:MAG: DUF2075 domain-containing protein [Candidatus Cloacimonetes bacterium]|nr:DUF2075 domain-containing protein [Candidatus Cloacimonadota bacterium]